jgi:methylglutaconyl-CoA hydratase
VAARAAKALVRDLRDRPAEDARAETVRRIARQRTSAEGQEGLTAFVEKRRPRW